MGSTVFVCFIFAVFAPVICITLALGVNVYQAVKLLQKLLLILAL